MSPAYKKLCSLTRGGPTLLAGSCLALVAFATAIPFFPAFAQQAPASPALLQNPSVGGNLTQFISARTPFEFWLTCVIGTLALLIIGILIIALKSVKNPRPEDIARPVIVITVIMSTLMLVTVGYSNEQIAPAFGLFGTIVGYMLGRLSQPSPSNDPNPPPTANSDQVSH